MKKKIKIICLNIWRGGILFEPMINFLQSQDADLYFLQEVFDSEHSSLDKNFRSITYLKNVLPKNYLFAPCFQEIIDGKICTQGNAIFSKYPLKKVNTYFYDFKLRIRDTSDTNWENTPRNLQHTICDFYQKPIHLFNTQGIWGQNGNDSSRRLKMGDTIMQNIPDQQSIILAGDFNLQPHTKTIKKIESKLNNVFKDKLTTSFNIKRKNLNKHPGYATAVVDMIFISSDIKIIKRKCHQDDISDHLALSTEIMLDC